MAVKFKQIQFRLHASHREPRFAVPNINRDSRHPANTVIKLILRNDPKNIGMPLKKLVLGTQSNCTRQIIAQMEC